MARIFMRHTETGQIKNVEEVILTEHLKKRGWVLHEVKKFEPKTELKQEAGKVEESKDEAPAEPKEPQEPKAEKPVKATRGRKPKQQ